MYTLLIPSYNDGESVAQLIHQVDKLLQDRSDITLDVHIINDGAEGCGSYISPPSQIRNIYEIQLVINLGHQRAIAVGLVELAELNYYEAVIIMDGDGEDKPEDVFKLLDCHIQHPKTIIVSQRTIRSENLSFQLFYRIYQLIFRVLVGKVIDFGNFMLLPSHVVQMISYTPNIWNHIAATILQLKVNLHRLSTSRGKRYGGRSKMNFESLVMHGLSAMSVYIINIYTRLLVMLSLMSTLVILGTLVIVNIRLFTTLAIPGWTSNLVGIFAIIFLQIIFLSLLLTFTTLNQRSNFAGIPKVWIHQYIEEKSILYERQDNGR